MVCVGWKSGGVMVCVVCALQCDGVCCLCAIFVVVVVRVLCCLVVLWGVLWNGGGGAGGEVLVICFPVSFLLLLRVGVRGSARAALRARTLSPNTIVFLVCLVCLVFFLCPAFPLLLPPFSVLEWRWGFTMCRSVRWA
nr:MAG TPA: hypothetical protein [Caudoviricetes sp.]